MPAAIWNLIGHLRRVLWNGAHVRAAEGFEKRHSLNALFGVALSAYFLLWMLYFCISNASVDTHFDLSEASVWAQHFAFGYKHPPMTAWLFIVWFSIFPREDWAAYLLAATTLSVTLALTWRLLRDYLDKERALVGIAALMLVPHFTFLASRLNANTVMMPFWVAAQLFYLRARRNLGLADAILAGVFVGLTFLGKYWAIYLVVGMAITSLVGSGTARFWRSPAPYLMALSAAAVVAPHVYWFVTDRSQVTNNFMAASVMIAQPFGVALLGSMSYLAGSVAYIVVPLIFFVFLQPTRAALADILWPADRDRQQAHLLFLLPLVLPILANLAFPHRLTALWTFPNWALLPVVLFGSPLITVYPVDAAQAGLVALSVSTAAVVASPYVAYLHAKSKLQLHEKHFRQVAGEISSLSHSAIPLIAGTKEIVQGLSFYLPKARLISIPAALDATALAGIRASGMVIICSSDDEACRSASTEIKGPADRSTDVTFVRTFLGFTSSQVSYHFTVISAAGTKDRQPNPSTQ
jgi:hypothetical protein